MSDRQAPDQGMTKRIARLNPGTGTDWPAILLDATELVVFGSQAAGLQTSSSDLDVLVVTKHPASKFRVRRARMDLVLRTEQETISGDWLESELASHIAQYGRWLKGVGEWRIEALASLRRSNNAANSKRVRINRLSEALSDHWNRLTPDFRRRNMVTLRRESQRYQLLQCGIAVPPTRLLDTRAEKRDIDSRTLLRTICSLEYKPAQLRTILDDFIQRSTRISI